MSFLDSFFNKKRPATSSNVARDRLQILLAHERQAQAGGDSTLLRTLHAEILEVLARHVSVDEDNVRVKLDRGQKCSKLEIDIQVPQSGLRAQVSTVTPNDEL
ncbi:cell division topological specificity factor MinE [Bombella saccharophila]|uniref:Cell division topological specificity factor n=1 Tax=Bombella saccharophila TaxID=2967338 RepID=A0ABT3W7H7_9PROT|nr:cell division topological specificity factor MinE [Bombella saccharophila]MCX5615027.1 cell division topological specificity factor MinE [Bombella saccharophila]PHI96284.1 cell division topological specificity factor MinE [Parasaccharibacter apium]